MVTVHRHADCLCVCVCPQVYDQYLNFITLEDDMFVLCHQNKDLISYQGDAAKNCG